MWGKKKAAADFGSFATSAIIQMLDGVSKSGVSPEHLLATDGMLHGYIGQGVKWEHVWASAAQRHEPLGGVGAAMLNFDRAYAYASGRTTVLQLGTKPYWTSEPTETQGVGPLSVLAFLGKPQRYRLAESDKTSSNFLQLMAGGSDGPGDADGMVRTAAFMNLVKRGLRTLG